MFQDPHHYLLKANSLSRLVTSIAPSFLISESFLLVVVWVDTSRGWQALCLPSLISIFSKAAQEVPLGYFHSHRQPPSEHGPFSPTAVSVGLHCD